MIRLLGLLVVGLFLALSGLHVYWAVGGRWGGDVAVPERNGKPAFTPSQAGTLLVAGAFLAAAWLVLGRLGIGGRFLPPWVFHWSAWGLAAVFLLRATGEFRTVGFFKRIRGTNFARWDTLLFSPLCL